MAEINEDITAYEAKQQEFESHFMGKWVLFHNREFIGTYDTFDNAASDAVARFGRGPYLIRQVGAPPVVLPASVMYRPDYAKHKVRV